MIFPSLWEGLPGAVLEAAAAGLPVIASQLPGLDEIAGHLPNVYTMPLASSDHDWAAAAFELHSSNLSGLLQVDNTFSNSPFSIQHHLNTCEHLYSQPK
jgi:glycosyltransferase involved in cell wall biosynthesis